MTKTQSFITRATAIHGTKYDYSRCVYSNASNEVEIICPHHKSFWQAANSHLLGHGCYYCGTHTHHVYEYLQKLNAEKGWNLVGGNQEYGIASKATPYGKYRFDGCDIQRLIFFEYNERPHLQNRVKSQDARKKARLKEWLAEQGQAGKGKYVVYNAFTNTLTEESI